MTFANPIWLAVGTAACAGLIVLIQWAGKQRQASLKRFAAGHLLGKLMANASPMRRRLKAVLLVIAVACLFVALARPQWGTRWEEVSRRGIDILLAVDTSRSMLAPDVTPNRLGRAKLGIFDFVSKLEGDRVGLLPFAGQAFLLCPLTLDYDAFRESLDAVDTEIIPEGGTDIAEAMRASEKAFERDANHKILVLITDGEDLEGEALHAAKAAAEKGITIYTVGVGTPNGERIPLGGTSFVTDENGEQVNSRLDEEMLRKIAEVTGGVYAPLGGRAEGLETIYREKLALVPKEELSQRTKEVKIDRFEWPLGLAMVLLVMEFCLGTATRSRRAADLRRRMAGRQRATGAAAVLLAIAWLPQMARASTAEADDPRAIYNDGTGQYEAGVWDAAEAAFQGALDTADVGLQGHAYYNLGNTAYRQGQAQLEGGNTEAVKERWEQAVKAYDDALALNAEDEDAIFNKAFVEKKLEELKQQQEQQEQEQQEQQNQEQQDQEQQQDQDQQNQDQAQDEQNQDAQNNQDQSQDESQDQSNQNQDQENQNDPQSGGGEQEAESAPQAQSEDQEMQSGDNSEQEGKEEESADDSKAAGEQPGEDEQKQEAQDAQPGDEAADDSQQQESGGELPEEESSGQHPENSADGESPGNPEPGNGTRPADQVANPNPVSRVPGEMTEEEAEQLLDSVQDAEGSFQPIPAQRSEGMRALTRSRRDW